MNYEELYGALAPLEKRMKDLAASIQKNVKSIGKNTENGDLKALAKDLAACQELLKAQESLRGQIQEMVEGFDGKEYMESGDYAGQLMELCQEKGVDITGTYPVFEMFPYRVRFDAENQDIYMNRKKVQCMRPASLVQTVRASQERLKKASFNEQTFLNELAEADRMKLIEKLWSCTNQYLLIVEPGTPTAFEHMKIIRECLIRQGASVVAPCPHNAECSLPAGDWCHFTSRVSRTKLHKLLKGGEAPFEDEKYSYLVFSRAQSGKKKSRILRHPVIESGRITLQLCTQSSSIETRAITKKDKALFKTARKSKCGDTFL